MVWLKYIKENSIKIPSFLKCNILAKHLNVDHDIITLTSLRGLVYYSKYVLEIKVFKINSILKMYLITLM